VQVVRECSRAKLASLLHVHVDTSNPDSNLTGFSMCKWAFVTQNANVLLLSKTVYRLFIAIVCCEIIAVVGSITEMEQQDHAEISKVLSSDHQSAQFRPPLHDYNPNIPVPLVVPHQYNFNNCTVFFGNTQASSTSTQGQVPVSTTTRK